MVLHDFDFLEHELFLALFLGCDIGKISLTPPIVIDVPTKASLAVETKGLLFLWLTNLNNKSNFCKQICSLLLILNNLGRNYFSGKS